MKKVVDVAGLLYKAFELELGSYELDCLLHCFGYKLAVVEMSDVEVEKRVKDKGAGDYELYL